MANFLSTSVHSLDDLGLSPVILGRVKLMKSLMGTCMETVHEILI